jgi:MSHA biogenesis protein MshJ
MGFDFVQKHQQLDTWYQGLSLRERILVMAALVGAVWMLWLFTIWEPLLGTNSNVQRDEQRLQAEAIAAGNSLSIQETVDREMQLLRSDMQIAEDELVQIEADIDEAMSAFVPPEQMVEVLRDVLVTVPGVEIVSLRSLLPKAVANGGVVIFYEHPVALEIEGSFAALHSYLASLEARNELLSFHSLDYQVIEHPLARATLRLSTLSRTKEWLGV